MGHKRRFLTATIRPFSPQKNPKINAKEFFTFILLVDYNGVQQQIVLPINCLFFKQTGEKTMQKPTLAEIIGAIAGFAALAVFVFMCLAY